jgi:hypothetical protein
MLQNRMQNHTVNCEFSSEEKPEVLIIDDSKVTRRYAENPAYACILPLEINDLSWDAK